ncbi:MAG: ABC transporter substrate binding protein [Pseudomonadota bacterium]
MRLINWLFITLILIFGSSAALCKASKFNVVFLLPENAERYESFAKSFKQELTLRNISSEVLSTDKITEKSISNNTKLIIGFGSKSLTGLKNIQLDVPVITVFTTKKAYEHRIEELGLSTQKVSAIFSDPPVKRQLSLIRLLFPKAKTIGLLLSEHNTFQTTIKKQAETFGFNTYTKTIDDDRTLVKALLDVVKQSDVLLAIRDEKVFNTSNIKTILLTSYRKNTLMVGVSPAFVRVGSVATTYSTQKDLAKELLEIIESSQYGNQGIAIQEPRHGKYFSVFVNKVVARSLGLAVPDSVWLAEQIRKESHKTSGEANE